MTDDTIHTESTSNRKTVHLPFFPIGREREPLFAVREDLPLDEALEAASYILSSAKQTAINAAQEEDGLAAAQSAWASVHLMDMAHAVLESASASVDKEAKS